MRVAYLDCFAGIAGDMALAALVDLGVPADRLASAIRLVGPPGLTLRIARKSSHGIDAARAEVTLSPSAPPQPRNYPAIVEAISGSALPPRTRERALAVFAALAAAEAKVHGTTVERVHFHEVGAWDSIADIVGTCEALTALEVDRVLASPLPMGTGFVQTRHGSMPLPAPATLELCRGLPIVGQEIEAELVTPTGAALLRALAAGFGPLPRMTVERVGWGAGTRELPDRPNLLRVVLGECLEPLPADEEWLIETNLDDLSPQLVGQVQPLLFQAGALDVWVAPIQMKKGRPGMLLSLLCLPDARGRLKELLLRHTTAIGVREQRVAMTRLRREMRTLETSFGPVRFKAAYLGSDLVNLAPEFDDISRIASDKGLPAKEVWAAVMAEARQKT